MEQFPSLPMIIIGDCDAFALLKSREFSRLGEIDLVRGSLVVDENVARGFARKNFLPASNAYANSSFFLATMTRLRNL